MTSKYSHHNSQPNPKGQLIIRDAEYQKNLALTFIDTLLSSQRTRTHHHHDPLGQPLRGNFSSLSYPGSPAQTGTPIRTPGEAQPYTMVNLDLPGTFVQPRVHSPSRSGVGVRVALKRVKSLAKKLN